MRAETTQVKITYIATGPVEESKAVIQFVQYEYSLAIVCLSEIANVVEPRNQLNGIATQSSSGWNLLAFCNC